MWSLHIHRRLSTLCDTCSGSRSWFLCSPRILLPPPFGFLDPSGRLLSTEASVSKLLDGHVRHIKSLGELQLLCNKAKGTIGRPFSISYLSIVGQLYVLRILDSSGVLWKPLEDCILEEVQFAQTTTWQLLTSIGHLVTAGDLTTPRSKHVVGLLWHLVKIADKLFKATDLSLVDPLVFQQVQNSTAPIVVTSTKSQGELHAVRLLLVCRLLKAVAGVLQRLHESPAKLNGKDVQQILMLGCSDLFLSMGQGSSDSLRANIDWSDIMSQFLGARGDAMKWIDDLATLTIHTMDDSEIASVYVACFNKEVNHELISLVSQALTERSAKGYLNLTIHQSITLFNCSKTNYVPKDALRVLLSQLDSCQFKGSQDRSSRFQDRQDSTVLATPPLPPAYPIHSSQDGIDWRHSFINATVTDIGRLCKSLYHLNCGKKLLNNLDTRLSSLLSSTYFRSRLQTRSRSDHTVINTGVMTVTSIVHLFAKNAYVEWFSLDRILEVARTIPWNDQNEDEVILLGDLCWSLLTLKVDIGLFYDLLERFMSKLQDIPVKHTVKLLCGFNNLLDKSPFLDDPDLRYSSGRESMDDMMVYTLQSMTFNNSSPEERTNSLESAYSDDGNYGAQNYIQTLRQHFMNRVQEVDEVQPISNFMFYVVSTLDNISLTEYRILCSRWLDISDRHPSKIRVEALTQVLWSLQKSRIHHEAFLIRVRQLLSIQLGWCSMGQLSLISHSLSAFNVQDEDFANSLLFRLESLVKDNGNRNIRIGTPRDDRQCLWEIKLVSVLWSIIITDFTKFNMYTNQKLLNVLRYVDWSAFMQGCKHQDLRKVLQIHTSLSVEMSDNRYHMDMCHPSSLIPDFVMSAATNASQAFANTSILSVSQDRVRRSLKSFGVHYKGEYEVYNGITVDFALSRNAPSEEFKPDLVIELDGPYHYNVVCDSCNAPYQQIGADRMIPSGKTMYRNRILNKLGYALETINWIDAHRRPVHQTLDDILRRHNYLVEVKQT